ncbi:MAG: zinc-ribbon domain-containing protein [Candidatus Izemoplasmatales bacterium]|jgi:hypothetical protein
MPYCKHCGSEIQPNQDICLNCGKLVNENNVSSQANQASDTGNFGWSLLGFCVPIVGLILYLIWKQERPRDAKAAGVGAIIGFAIGIISQIWMIPVIFG